MKFLLASLLIASLGTAFAQAPAKPAAKPEVRKPVAAKKPAAPSQAQRQAIEEATPTEEPDPSLKLTEADLAIARRVHTGEIQCELGAKVTIKAMKREGFFFVTRGVNRFVMHPVEARTNTIRLEDPVRGALWLQLGNKSMLMSQKEGKRLADDCKSPEQEAFAKDMKPVNLLEPAPKAAAPAAPLAPAAPASPNSPGAATAPSGPSQ